ncbi:hypothetical protein PHLGIDRAFT_192316 [Phlebiopsis gigantea 11061_1 CR5-6]|uniref:Uncharacterized protein n=1 Tax=Phlebiopsis gigantea (strain 11061_1 CR5-6) TaxID=745531 RepID=A0A0C3RU75_PHLG1|nr:hypothetical protein PHLGIDRAFT_192316 [Phlebiopsis gigantea 11061_1 CR5-6]
MHRSFCHCLLHSTYHMSNQRKFMPLAGFLVFCSSALVICHVLFPTMSKQLPWPADSSIY